ncbi:MAG TPA: choice-of-anchor tandem repeat GloVer-containing protein, partial [Nevskiaceae bacterium]|nr:choice-of-anchor tandem repeat GloVer-containing protein [Nevskiaceae bacterium]
MRYLKRIALGALLSCASAAHAYGEGTDVVYRFGSTDGQVHGRIAFGPDGNLYGTTEFGGASDRGTVFKVTPQGAYTRLVDFDGSNGAFPSPTLVLGDDGNFYGTTYGFNVGPGTAFRVTPNGVLTTLHTFSGGDGVSSGVLVRGQDGTIYGVGGKLYSIDASGHFQIVTDLSPSLGAVPDVIVGSDGALYGAGGIPAWPYSVVFSLVPSPNSTLQLLHQFDGSRSTGAWTYVGVAEAKDGYLWGCTSGSAGHDSIDGTIYRVRPDGTGFQIVRDLGYGSYCGAQLLRAGDDLYGAYITEVWTTLLVRIKPDGTFVQLSDVNIDGGITLSPDGTMYAAASAYRNNQIIRLHRPTDLVAKGEYTVAPVAGKVTFNPQGTLSDAVTHAGVAGRKIYFTTNKGKEICVGYTDATGFAKCKATLLGHADEFTGGRVVARFADDGTYG